MSANLIAAMHWEYLPTSIGRDVQPRVRAPARFLSHAQTGALRRPLDGRQHHHNQQQQPQRQRRMGSVQAAALAERPASIEESAKEIEAETVALKPSSREEQARVSVRDAVAVLLTCPRWVWKHRLFIQPSS